MAVPEFRASLRGQKSQNLSKMTDFFESPALTGKTHRDLFFHCCLSSVKKKRVNIWPYLPHALMDLNQTWVMDATWEPSFVDEVKGHIPRLKVI